MESSQTLNEKITIEHARKRLGKKADNMTDKQINDILNMLRLICNKTIDAVVDKKGAN
ncbi:MAG TPA: hypothetical protein VLG12_02500 [Candidatus Saccharimonadales bacterium]|nr:hypothetical protein [Candidatus Saccharimonadales bacterium]